MSQPLRQNRQVERSREWILEALLRLMEKKRFSDITITEICKLAGVGRQTFYRRFASKEEIIKHELDRSFQEYMKNLFERYGITPSPQEIIIEGFNHWRKNERMHLLFIKQNMDEIFIKSLEQHFNYFRKKQIIQPEWDDYFPEFALGGILLVLLAWVKNGMQESAEEMGEIVSNFFNRDYFKR